MPTDDEIKAMVARIPTEPATGTVYGFKPVMSWLVTAEPDDPIIALFISAQAFNTLMADNMFIQCMEPTPKLAEMSRGLVGSVGGRPVLTDAYFHPDCRVSDSSAWVAHLTAKTVQKFNIEPAQESSHV